MWNVPIHSYLLQNFAEFLLQMSFFYLQLIEGSHLCVIFVPLILLVASVRLETNSLFFLKVISGQVFVGYKGHS